MKTILELKEMPQNCMECIFSIMEYSSSIPWCKVTTENCEKPRKKRNDKCPLKEVRE